MVPASTATGAASGISCHPVTPEARVTLPCPRGAPPESPYTFPVKVPPAVASLRRRTFVIDPACEDRNFTPTSMGWASLNGLPPVVEPKIV